MDPHPRGGQNAAAVPRSPTKIPVASWSAIFRRSARQFRRDDVPDRAAALTYFGVLAIFPGLLALVSILGLTGRSTTQKALDNLKQVAPGGVNTFLRTVIQQVQGRAGAASLAAIVGIVLALWSASAYVAAFMRASNRIYGVDEGRPMWRTVPVRMGVTVLLTAMLVASVLIIVVTGPVADQIGHALGIGNAAVLAWNIAKWPVLVILVSLMFTLLFWACPNVKQPKLRWITPGGVLAVIIWLIASGLFALYLSFFNSYNKTYGSLAAMIIFLVWLWLSNTAVLLGVEFDAETQRQRLVEAGMPEEVEPFAEVRDTRKLDPIDQRRVEEAARIRRATTRH